MFPEVLVHPEEAAVESDVSDPDRRLLEPGPAELLAPPAVRPGHVPEPSSIHHLAAVLHQKN
jgi:hypothetical protein